MNEEQKIRKTLESLTDALDYLELLRINRAHAIQNKQPGIVALLNRKIKYYQSKIHKISSII
jgi:hypothetical protein